jgi:transcriptional regulator with XRE-family HTH domain
LIIEARDSSEDTATGKGVSVATRSSARKILATNLKRLRKAAGISQAGLAERAGCSPTMIGNIEIMKRFPSAESLDKLAKALGVPVYELFMEESPAIARALDKSEVRERLAMDLRTVIEAVLDAREKPSEE